MTAGRERSVTMWDVRESLLRQRMEAIAHELDQLTQIEEPLTRKRRERISELEDERRRITVALAQLGPAPRAKMG
ncbi:MAG TPA: hypothetical protein VE338_14750 [Ktedonobacterales bacterium]|nr:hypothetical protein [Ktedonobacterales bacterium]